MDWWESMRFKPGENTISVECSEKLRNFHEIAEELRNIPIFLQKMKNPIFPRLGIIRYSNWIGNIMRSPHHSGCVGILLSKCNSAV